MSCGIYCITNVVNNKKYIGQSKNIEKRWKSHIRELNNNKHGNDHLQNAWKTYGASGFTFSIIEYCSQSEITEREDYWIKKCSSLDKRFGYNLRDAAPGGSFRPESIEKMRQSQVGNNVGENNTAAKITTKQAQEIIHMLSLGYPIKKIQELLDVPYRTIHHIRNRDNWTHLSKNVEFPTTETSSYRGVSYDKKYKKWRSNVSFNKQRVYLEYFDTEIDAAKARDKQAKKYFGNKAKLNFPN